MKKLSSDFLVSLMMVIGSFALTQFLIVPSLAGQNTKSNSSYIPAKVYNIQESKTSSKAFTFNYKIYKPSSNLKPTSANFDLPIENFDDKSANLEVGDPLAFSRFGEIRDFWNYPVQENAYMALLKKDDKKGGQGDPKSDNDPNILGLVNCRENTNTTGYFKAYFEDVAMNTGTGYDDNVHGTARRAVACEVLQSIASLIKLNTTTLTPDILFTHDAGNLPAGSLAGASAYLGYEQLGIDNGSLHYHITSHIDPTPEAGYFDAFVITNFNSVNWDVDSSLNNNTYSLSTTLYHEIMHALGFRSILPPSIVMMNVPINHTSFDGFMLKDSTLTHSFFNLTNILGNSLIPPGAPSPWFISDQAVYRGKKNIPNSPYDGVHPIYTPTSWQQGSTLAHFDMNRANGQVYVMNKDIDTNTTRTIHSDEKEVLCHIGYQVSGVAGCENPSPFAEDDFVSFTPENAVCIKPLLNDHSFDGGSLSIYALSLTTVQVGDSVSYYASNNCSGNSQANPLGAKSLSFTSNSVANLRIFTYEALDSFSNRISEPAQIRLESCESAPGEYVCNGSFEYGVSDTTTLNGSNTMSCGISQVSSWCSTFPTADLFIRNAISGGLNLSIPTNFFSVQVPGGQVDTHNGAPNNRYVGFYDQHVNHAYEGVQTHLRQPLTAGGHYILRFYLHPAKFGQNSLSPSYTDIYLSDHAYNGDLLSGTEYLGQVTGPLNTWTQIEIPFTASSDYEYLYINASQSTLGDYYNYIDDVSITAGGNGGGGGGVGNTNTGSISGKVYQDTDLNGTQGIFDPGLSGITLGIFPQGGSIPLQTVVSQELPNAGAYSFSPIPPGTYEVAIMNENVFPTISEPQTNAVFPPFSHAREITIQNGQSAINQNFGVTLTGQEPPVDHANISIKKVLSDATLSLTDRNITFQVYVTNQGPDEATNIVVNDMIPPPLIFYSYTSTPPTIYNAGNGNFTISTLGPGQSVGINIIMKVPANACGQVVNTATLTSLDQIDTYFSDNTASASLKLKSCSNKDEATGLKK